jgi:hypothetical protein
MHLFSGVQMTGKEGNLDTGGELNPDAEANDIGYSRGDSFITHFFDTTNMRMYRWTVMVNVNHSVMALERLY